jgi:hypothetical protein
MASYLETHTHKLEEQRLEPRSWYLTLVISTFLSIVLKFIDKINLHLFAIIMFLHQVCQKKKKCFSTKLFIISLLFKLFFLWLANLLFTFFLKEFAFQTWHSRIVFCIGRLRISHMVFDLLKNIELVRIIFVLCLILKMFFVLNKLKSMDKTRI